MVDKTTEQIANFLTALRQKTDNYRVPWVRHPDRLAAVRHGITFVFELDETGKPEKVTFSVDGEKVAIPVELGRSVDRLYQSAKAAAVPTMAAAKRLVDEA